MDQAPAPAATCDHCGTDLTGRTSWGGLCIPCYRAEHADDD